MVDKKININRKLSKERLLLKIKNDLIITGYNKDIINEVLNNTYIEENDDVIEMEFKKEYKKLSRKYSDKELNNKLKYNLYKKGFSLTKIEELINKY